MEAYENRTGLCVNIAGVEFKNPVIAASGTFGFGRDYSGLFDIGKLGGISLKALTSVAWQGNPTPRIAETPCGMLNSIGLQNPGAEYFIENELPFLRGKGTRLICNIAGRTTEEYCEVSERLSETDIDMIELNISCPNVKKGGASFGTSPEGAAAVTKAVRAHCSKPLMVKLSPNVTDIAEIALAVEEAGADALSLINTLLGMRIDISTRRPILGNNLGGLSGPAVFPVALGMVYRVANRVKIPVVGVGGIARWQDAAEMLLAGASAVQVGCATFHDPYAMLKIIDGLQRYMEENGVKNIRELTGAVRPNEGGLN